MSCEKIEILRGQDCNCNLEVRDFGGTLIDITYFSKVAVWVKHATGQVIGKFTNNATPPTGYNIIEMANASSGILTIRLLSVHTMAGPAGKLFYEVHLQTTDAQSTDDSNLDLITKEQYLCDLKDSLTGGLTLP